MFSIKAAVIAFIASLEGVGGTPIAILDRIDNTQQFWVRSAAILCAKTGDNFCDDDLRFMTTNTEPTGFSRIIEYKTSADGPTKRVCAVLPPIDNVDPSYVAEAFTGGFTIESDYPSSTSMAAWLYLYHAAHCLDVAFTDGEESRAQAFATLALTILQGDPLFAYPEQSGQSRRIATMIKSDAAWWAAGTGERIMFEHFKAEAAQVLRSEYDCDAAALPAATIDTTGIARARELPAGSDCSADGDGGRKRGTVSDANLWVWMYGNGGLGAPPLPYAPAKMFPDMDAAARYVLSTANSLAK